MLRGDSGSPEHVAYRPDGKLLASSGLDGIVQLWDPVSRKNVRTIRGGAALMGLAFAADGRRLVTCSQLNLVAVWDPDTGQDPFTLRVSVAPMVAVSPDGQRLACATDDGVVTVWDPASGQRLLTLHGHSFRAQGVAFSPDGSLLATGPHDHTAKLWDPVTGQLLATLKHEASIYGVAFSPNGALLATCTGPSTEQHEVVGQLHLWSVASRQRVRALSGHTQYVWSVEFSPDGRRLVSASDDQTARVWDVKTGQEKVCFRGHHQVITHARFSPDGRRIATTSGDETVKVWDAETGDVIHTLRGHGSVTRSAAFSRDGRRIASASGDGTIKIWDAASGQELLTLSGHPSAVESVVFGPEDQWLASGGYTDGTIRLWEATPLTPERRLQREAAALVNALPSDLGFKDEILTYLRTLPSLSEPLREHALSMAERLQEDPWRLNLASALVARRAGLKAAEYRLALRRAEAARDLAHPGFYFNLNPYHASTQIGIAHYRLGEYPEAVKALIASEAYYAADPYHLFKTGTPWNLAFLAMAHHQLGEKDYAAALLSWLHGLMKDVRWASRDELHTFVREADDLCVWGAPAPTEEERRLRREAADLVDNKLPATLGFKDEILDYLRTLTLPTDSEPLREHALTIVERLPGDPWRLNKLANAHRGRRKARPSAARSLRRPWRLLKRHALRARRPPRHTPEQ